MDLAAHFRMLARYNCIANGRLYQACRSLTDAEYRRSRHGSFGSIHALLNHLLLADRIWMSRFEGGGQSTPPLNTVLAGTFEELLPLREAEDQRIEAFFDRAGAAFLESTISYTNSRGIRYAEMAPVAAAHFFNHQTHHRGQVHTMLSEAGVQPPSLDLHRIINP